MYLFINKIKVEGVKKKEGLKLLPEINGLLSELTNNLSLGSKEKRNGRSRVSPIIKKQDRTIADDQKEEDAQGVFKVLRRPIKIITHEESKEFSFPEETKVNTSVNTLKLKKKLKKMLDVATDTMDRNQLVADTSTQTIRTSHKRKKKIKKQPNIIAQTSILLLRKCRCFACYHKYMQMIGNNKSALGITSGKLTLPRIQIYKKSPSALEQYKIRLISKNHLPNNDNFNGIEKHIESIDWGNSVLFKAISNNETHIWKTFPEKQILTEGEISKFLDRTMKKDYKWIRPKIENTFNKLCKILGIRYTIDKWNTTDVSIHN